MGKGIKNNWRIRWLFSILNLSGKPRCSENCGMKTVGALLKQLIIANASSKCGTLSFHTHPSYKTPKPAYVLQFSNVPRSAPRLQARRLRHHLAPALACFNPSRKPLPNTEKYAKDTMRMNQPTM